MRAVVLQRFGGPEELVSVEAPDPVARPGQALVDVAFANVTFVDTQFRATGRGPFTGQPPLIPGNGVGGVVTAVGAETHGGLVRRRVVGSTGGSGGYAERAVVDIDNLVDVPDGLALDDAVALLADGRTALMLIEAAELRAGNRVLVEAAAGGVGTLLVQLAATAGAIVIALAGEARKLDVARRLGAAVVVDYRQPDWTQHIRDSGGGVDVVFDGVGGSIARSAFGLLARGGRMVSFGAASGEWADIPDGRAASRQVTLLQPHATPEELLALTRRALGESAAGRLQPVIGQRFPLGRAAEAHAAIHARTTIGKTLLVSEAAGRIELGQARPVD